MSLRGDYMSNTKKPDSRYNDSSCIDMTAYEAIENIRREERKKLISEIKKLAKDYGYRITNVIEIEEIEGD